MGVLILNIDPNFLFRIVLIWQDQRFMKSNMTIAQTKMCYPGIVRKEQVDELWKPGIYIDGTVDGVSRATLIISPLTALFISVLLLVLSQLLLVSEYKISEKLNLATLQPI